MPDPYREPQPPPPPCAHKHVTRVALTGGAGPDYATHHITCDDCGASRFEFMYNQRSYSEWRPET